MTFVTQKNLSLAEWLMNSMERSYASKSAPQASTQSPAHGVDSGEGRLGEFLEIG
jgi:hypothetical protein